MKITLLYQVSHYIRVKKSKKYNDDNNNNSVYFLSAHSIRFDAHGAIITPAMHGHHKDTHDKQGKFLPGTSKITLL